jgi:hypothetical protein
MEEDDDNGSVVQGKWERKIGYVTECDIDARWVLYYPNDPRPQGSLRIVSHPDLPPGHLRSYVSIVTKRWPKTKEDYARTFQQFGLLDDNDINDLFFYNGAFYKKKIVTTYYIYNNVTYRNKILSKRNGRTIASYTEPFNVSDVTRGKIHFVTPVVNDEFTIVLYEEPFTDGEIRQMLTSLAGELEAYNIDENVQTWDTESRDTMKNLEKLYNVKIFA